MLKAWSRVPRALRWGIIGSLLLHVFLLFPPFAWLSWKPAREPEPTVLQARLLPPPRSEPVRRAPPPAAAPVRQRAASAGGATRPALMSKAEGEGPAVAPPSPEEGAAAPGGAPDAAQASGPGANTAGEPAGAAPGPVLRDGRPWPPRGRIVYDVHRGDQGLVLGQTIHTWFHDATHYSMRAEIHTTGLAALLKSFSYVQVSAGRLAPGGLVPESFSVQQSGRSPEGASFDWAAGEVHIQRRKGEKVAAISVGDQDVLSLWHQLAFGSSLQDGGSLLVVSASGASQAHVQHVGTESLSMPQGVEEAEHWRVQTDDGRMSVDLWLAPAHAYAPLRIRIQDGSEVIDQVAREMVLEGSPDLAPPPQTAPMTGSGPDYSP